MQDFVHLHVHTQYSILDGQASVSRLVDKAMKDGMRGMAITDHGNMMAIKEFFNYTTKKNSGTNADIKMWKKRIALLENGEDAALKEWVDGQKKKQKEADELRRRAEANDEPIRSSQLHRGTQYRTSGSWCYFVSIPVTGHG